MPAITLCTVYLIFDIFIFYPPPISLRTATQHPSPTRTPFNHIITTHHPYTNNHKSSFFFYYIVSHILLSRTYPITSPSHPHHAPYRAPSIQPHTSFFIHFPPNHFNVCLICDYSLKQHIFLFTTIIA